MPYKNKADHFYPTISIAMRKSEPALYEALVEAAKQESLTLQAYFQKALREKLIRDGYILESDK